MCMFCAYAKSMFSQVKCYLCMFVTFYSIKDINIYSSKGKTSIRAKLCQNSPDFKVLEKNMHKCTTAGQRPFLAVLNMHKSYQNMHIVQSEMSTSACARNFILGESLLSDVYLGGKCPLVRVRATSF